MEKKGLRFYYDKEADVLYFSRGTPSPDSISQEIGDGIIIRMDPATNRIKGFTVLNFSRRFEKVKAAAELPLDGEFELIST